MHKTSPKTGFVHNFRRCLDPSVLPYVPGVECNTSPECKARQLNSRRLQKAAARPNQAHPGSSLALPPQWAPMHDDHAAVRNYDWFSKSSLDKINPDSRRGQELALKNGDTNEIPLWHGTSTADPLEIVRSELGLGVMVDLGGRSCIRTTWTGYLWF